MLLFLVFENLTFVVREKRTSIEYPQTFGHKANFFSFPSQHPFCGSVEKTVVFSTPPRKKTIAIKKLFGFSIPIFHITH